LECVLQTESKEKESEISMSNMKKLLESVTKFAGEPKQKPGDQVRGHERAKASKNSKHPFAGRLVGGSANESKEEYCDACDRVSSKCICDDDLKESLMKEYKYHVKEQTPPAANAAPTSSSPVANINPAGTGTTATQPAATTAAPAKPGTTAPAGQPAAQKPATGVPGAGTATPPNPQQVKQATDTVTKIMNNPADPFNAQLQALLKKAGMIPR
jgi:hypothetical protein